MKKKDTYKYELHDGHKTVYVGTTKDPKRREAEHRADGKEFTNNHKDIYKMKTSSK